MRKTKHRICLGCNQPFVGRIDARTCSPKCRKRFQRAQALYRAVIEQSTSPAGIERQAAYAKNGSRRGYYAR